MLVGPVLVFVGPAADARRKTGCSQDTGIREDDGEGKGRDQGVGG